MRLVCWNVCDAFRQKFGHLERLGPDIAVLQEVRPACLEYAGLHGRSFWIGDAGQKGLAVVAYNGWELHAPEAATSERWFLPVVATRGPESLHLVAVWVDSSRDCAPPTLSAVADLREFIGRGPCILAGDFNQTVSMDRQKGSGRRFADVLAALDERGLTSAWHSHTGEAHGAESAATLYWTWNRERTFHIDFAFGSRDLRVDHVALGTFGQYVEARISDHVPLTIDYKLSGS